MRAFERDLPGEGSAKAAASAGCSEAEWQARVDLAAAYRLAAHFGWDDLIYTHLSARVPGEETFLLNEFGDHFSEVTASGLVKVDTDGRPVDRPKAQVHRAAFVIHSAIHGGRPDLNCVIHLHTRAGMAVSCMACGLLPLTQHAMLFHGDVGYHDSEGIAIDMDERAVLQRDLGDRSVLILRNHGVLVGGRTMCEAISRMWHLEQAMKVQVDLLASGQAYTLPSTRTAEKTVARGFTDAAIPEYPNGQSPLGRMEWPALRRLLDRVSPGYDR